MEDGAQAMEDGAMTMEGGMKRVNMNRVKPMQVSTGKIALMRGSVTQPPKLRRVRSGRVCIRGSS